MISVDRLISDLTALHIDHQEVFVEVQVDVDGKPHRLPLGAMEFGPGGTRLCLVAQPAPTPDPVIVVGAPGTYEGVTPHMTVHPDGRVEQHVAMPQHAHEWWRDEAKMVWECRDKDCSALVTDDVLLAQPLIPRDPEAARLLLDQLAEGLTTHDPLPS